MFSYQISTHRESFRVLVNYNSIHITKSKIHHNTLYTILLRFIITSLPSERILSKSRLCPKWNKSKQPIVYTLSTLPSSSFSDLDLISFVWRLGLVILPLVVSDPLDVSVFSDLQFRIWYTVVYIKREWIYGLTLCYRVKQRSVIAMETRDETRSTSSWFASVNVNITHCADRRYIFD